MREFSLKALPGDTVRLLGSSQVITSVFSVVKELAENAFDAEASSLEVKLENFGLDRVEVRDNGCGIKASSVAMVAKQHHTSKISTFSDLDSLETYGFRGEALGSLCSVSLLTIMSKTSEEDVSFMYTFDHRGNITSQVPSHLGQGTTVCAENLFKNLPVRRQFYNTVKKKKEELKRIEDLLMAYGFVRPDVRIVLKNNKDIVWQKLALPDTRSAVLAVFGRSCLNQMELRVAENAESQITVEAFLPRCDSDVSVTSRSTNDRCFLAVNKRPVILKDIEKVVRQHYVSRKGCDGRFPVFFIHITVSPANVDVNVDPNKTNVMLHKQNVVMDLVIKVLEEVFGPVQKSRDADKDKCLEHNDSAVSDPSSNTSLDNSGKINDVGQTCQKEKNKSITSIHTSASARLNCDKVGKDGNDFLDKGSKIAICDGNRNLNDVDSVEGMGNKLIFHHVNGDITDRNTTEEPLEHVYKSDIREDRTLKQSRLDGLGSEDRSLNQVGLNGHHKLSEGNENMMTQVEKGSFDLLDPDFEDLLKTQASTGTVSITDVLNNTDEILAEINTSLIGDIGELGKSISDSMNRQQSVDKLPLGTKDDTGNIVQGEETAKSVDKQCKGMEDLFRGNAGIEEVSWSRGKSALFENGENIQPVQVLAGKKRPASPSLDLDMVALTPPVKKKSAESQFDQPKLYDMVGKSPAEKNSLGFLAFSKDIRPKVLEENPDSSYDEITKIVRQKWEMLSDDRQREFVNCGKTHMQEHKKKVSEKKKLSQKIDRRLQSVVGTPSIKDQLLSLNQKDSNKDIQVKSVRVTFCLKKLQHVFSQNLRQSQTQRQNKLRLVGPLKFYNSWVFTRGNKILVLNPHRVEEALLHRELMENHIIPSTRLENSVGVTESSVGGQALYEQLLKLIPKNTSQTYVYLDDKRLKANGIEIQCHLDQHSKPVLEITGLARCMPLYGIKDLQEILDLIVSTGAETVYESRPLKVAYYLQSEAVRMVRQRPVHRNREDMLDLLEQMKETLPADSVTCLHNKPFLETVYDMSNFPLSQTL